MSIQDAGNVTCTRRIQFCAGHRVKGHENKCGHLHGHNYVALCEARAKTLDHCARVIDFSVLKNILGTWIDDNWDHGFLLWKEDTEAIKAVAAMRASNGSPQKLYLMPANPTAETMAEYLYKVGNDLLRSSGVELVRVKVWETENCYATFTKEEGT